MKKIVIAVIVLLMVAGLAACANPMQAAINEMAQENDQQSSSDSGLESSADSSDEQADVNISQDGDSVTISGEDGDISYQGDENGMPWPGDKLPASVPEIPGVKVVVVMDVDGGLMVAFENCEQSVADAYLAQLKSSGWTSSMDISSEDGYAVFFSKGNEALQFGWTKSDKTGSVVYSVSE